MNFIKELVGCFYSRQFYYDLCHKGEGIGLRFMFFITCLNALFGFQGAQMLYPHWRETLAEMPDKVSGLPNITMEKGHLSIDKPVPYVLTFGDGKIVIDTSYQIGDLEVLKKYLQNEHVIIFFTADKQISVDQAGALKIDDYETLKDFKLTREDWGSVVHLRYFALGLILFLSFIAFFIRNIFTALVVGAAFTLCRLIARKKYPNYTAAVRMAAAMRIPAKLINTEPHLLGFVSPGISWSAITWTLWMGYFFFALWSCNDPAKTLSQQSPEKG